MSNVVAIVGQPNVGKSTLFNRLTGAKKAIIEASPGVTRDRHYGEVEWAGTTFTLIDTGGYVKGSTDQFESEIRSQVHIAIDEANVIIYLLDCTTGLTGYEKEIAHILRVKKKPLLIVANKADNLKRELYAKEFYKLGLGHVYPISSISGYGTGDVMDKLIDLFSPNVNVKENSVKDIPKISVIGRPNVGKSSFVNALLGKERNIVTTIAGTTRDSINSYYNLFNKEFILTDTAGIRKKSKVTDNIEFYSVIRSIKALHNSDVCVVMIDSKLGLESQEMNFISIAHRYKKGILIVVNKWDLVDKNHQTMDQFKKTILQKVAPFTYIPILFISSIKKQKIMQVVDKFLDVYKNKHTKINTSVLNSVLLPTIAKYPPPAVRGKYIKIKYITQLPTKNITIAFFCNHPKHVKEAYKSFLEKHIRLNFKLEGVPIKLVFREK